MEEVLRSRLDNGAALGRIERSACTAARGADGICG
jgi:hypothetical protein